MSLNQLRWISTVLPAIFMVLVAMGSAVPDHYGLLTHAEEHALVAAVMVASVVPFWWIVFRVVGSTQDRLARQNQELATLHQAAIHRTEALSALHQAGLALTSELSLQSVLHNVVDLSRELTYARYGALAVRGAGDEAAYFVTSGLDLDEAARIGAPTTGRDLLCLKPADCGSAGPDRDCLLVPIVLKGCAIGNLYLAAIGPCFADDADLLRMFALQAAIAIENAQLYEQLQRATIVRERERVAHEMHDGLAQVLGYVNTKAQAVGELLHAGRYETAAAQVQELASAAQGLHDEVRQAILDLRDAAGLERGLIPVLKDYLEQFEERSGVAVHLEVLAACATVTCGLTTDMHVLRIIQEALTNVRKHAHASEAWVRFAEGPDAIIVTITDYGRGFEPDRDGAGSRSFGLRTMEERAAAIGASFAVDTAPGCGTRISLRLPSSSTGRRREPCAFS